MSQLNEGTSFGLRTLKGLRSLMHYLVDLRLADSRHLTQEELLSWKWCPHCCIPSLFDTSHCPACHCCVWQPDYHALQHWHIWMGVTVAVFLSIMGRRDGVSLALIPVVVVVYVMIILVILPDNQPQTNRLRLSLPIIHEIPENLISHWPSLAISPPDFSLSANFLHIPTQIHQGTRPLALLLAPKIVPLPSLPRTGTLANSHQETWDKSRVV